MATVRTAPLPPEHTVMIERHHHAMDDDDATEHHRPHIIPMTVPAQPAVDPTEAAQKGYWELLPCEAPVLAVHAALLHTGKVLFFAGSGNDELYTTGLRSAVYNYDNGTFATPTTPADVFCAGQTFPTAVYWWPAAPNATTLRRPQDRPAVRPGERAVDLCAADEVGTLVSDPADSG